MKALALIPSMLTFIPGKIVTTLITKMGNEAVIRYPLWQDLPELQDYINALSQEDTFIRYSGEVISREEEAEFLAGSFKEMELSNKVILCAFIEDDIAGICGIDRNERHGQRGRHVGIFGIAVAAQFRGEGIGYGLAKAAIEEADKKMPGLRILSLDVFETNHIARKLYEKLGFREVGRIPGGIFYKGEHMDDISMGLELH